MKAPVLSVVLSVILLGTPVFASQVPSQTDTFKVQVDELLKSDQYSEVQETQRWVKDKEILPELETDTDIETDWLDDLLEVFASFSLGLGRVGKLILLLLLAIFVVWLIVKYQDRLVLLVGKARPKRTKIGLKDLILETEVFEGVPEQDELYEVAKALFERGQFVPCLSLLYRGTLRLHNVAYDLPITKSQTEHQCQTLLAKTRQASVDEKRFFDELINIWQVLAYGKGVADGFKENIHKLLNKFNQLYPANFVGQASLLEGGDDGDL